MPTSLIHGPVALPLSLQAAKDHLRVDGSDEDDLITAYLAAATDWAESFTGRRLVTAVQDLVLHAFPSIIYPPGGPLRKVTAVSYVDDAGASQTLATTAYQVKRAATPGVVLPAYGQTWPQTRAVPEAVTLRCTVGHATPFTAAAGSDTLTAPHHPYSNGEVVRLSNSGGALPAGLAGMTDYYVVNAGATTLQLSATSGGAAIDITDEGTGTHYLGEMPTMILAAVRLVLGEAYARREDALAGAVISTVPRGADRAAMPWRIYGATA